MLKISEKSVNFSYYFFYAFANLLEHETWLGLFVEIIEVEHREEKKENSIMIFPLDSINLNEVVNFRRLIAKRIQNHQTAPSAY